MRVRLKRLLVKCWEQPFSPAIVWRLGNLRGRRNLKRSLQWAPFSVYA